jgi:hypothetical protein
MEADDAPPPGFGELSVDLGASLLRLAGPHAAARAGAVCRAWRAAATHPPLWQAFFREHWRPLVRRWL